MSRGPTSRRAGSPLGSVRFRLVLFSFAITTAAVGFVYLYVVPQLSSSLTAERLEITAGIIVVAALAVVPLVGRVRHAARGNARLRAPPAR